MKHVAGALCAYEVVSIYGRRTPTLTTLCRTYPWLAPVLLGSLGVHLYRRAA